MMPAINKCCLLLLFIAGLNIDLSAWPDEEVTPPYSEKDTITIASDPDYPPFCLVNEDGKADGFSIDLFRSAAEAVGLHVNIKIGIWNRIKTDLAAGKIDALPLVGRTPEREELFDFTMPYLSLHGGVFVRKGTKGTGFVKDLENKEIVVMKGDNAEEFVRRANISNKIYTTNTFEEAFKELAAGRYDAVITQRITGLHLIEELGLISIEVLDIQLRQFRQDFCFAVREGDRQLLDRLNEGLSIVIANDTYEELHHKWFGPKIKEELSPRDVLRIVFYTILPFSLITAFLYILILRRQVRKRTKTLNEEIKERKKTEAELTELKNKLEEQIVTRTAQLKEQLEKIDDRNKAMLYMVEDLNQITRELEEQKQKLELSNRELEAFSYSVSHDLRSPLRAINGFSGFLLEEYGPRLDQEGIRYINTIRQNTTKMDRFITDLLNYSRLSRTDIKRMDVDMAAVAASVYDEIANNRKKNDFEIRVGSLPPAFCDLSLIKIVWQNLLSNALKYSARSKIKKVEVGYEKKDDRIIYHVRDHGAGFDDKYNHKLFEVFQRLHKDEEYTGSGVGLAIVKRIINRHGGEVWAEGKTNEGACFYFSLPAKNPEVNHKK